MKKSENNTLMNSDRTLLQIQRQMHSILEVWKANGGFQLRDTKFEDFEKMSSEYDRVTAEIENRNRELHELRTTRHKLVSPVEKMISRVRSGMRGYFGPQSSEYLRVRRPPPKKPASKAKKPSNRMNMLRHLDSQPTPAVPPAPAEAPVLSVLAATTAKP
jgi:hypothetical protein